MTADDEDAELDHARMFDEVEKVVKSSCTVAEGMSRIVELCAASRPHPDWERFVKLDFAADLEHLRSWLMDVFSDAPDEEDDGVWFGLFNPSYDGEDAADMHVLASPYDPESSGEWASEVSWRPYDDCARSRVQKRIFDVAYGGKGLSFDDEDRATDTVVEPLGNDAEYPLCLAYAGLAVRHLATELHPLLFLGNAERRILFVGFDSGDYICIGALTEGGLQFSQDSFEFEAES
jgi:hypothetical protein